MITNGLYTMHHQSEMLQCSAPVATLPLHKAITTGVKSFNIIPINNDPAGYSVPEIKLTLYAQLATLIVGARLLINDTCDTSELSRLSQTEILLADVIQALKKYNLYPPAEADIVNAKNSSLLTSEGKMSDKYFSATLFWSDIEASLSESFRTMGKGYLISRMEAYLKQPCIILNDAVDINQITDNDISASTHPIIEAIRTTYFCKFQDACDADGDNDSLNPADVLQDVCPAYGIPLSGGSLGSGWTLIDVLDFLGATSWPDLNPDEILVFLSRWLWIVNCTQTWGGMDQHYLATIQSKDLIWSEKEHPVILASKKIKSKKVKSFLKMINHMSHEATLWHYAKTHDIATCSPSK